MNKNITIIVPHGDDEVLGFGGIIQKHVQDKDIVKLIFCRRPIDTRTQQQFFDIDKSQSVLGFETYTGLNMSEIEMSHNQLDFFRKLEVAIKDQNPEIVYTTFWNDIHQDHKITFEWVSRAVRVHGPINVKQFYVGEIPSSTDQKPYITGNNFNPNYYVPLTKEQIENKIKALECYSTEIMKYPHPRSSDGIYNLALKRGSECNSDYAEAFMCLRYIV
jgi:LmbE family N-acetylglucosaminyl deacetylase